MILPKLIIESTNQKVMAKHGYELRFHALKYIEFGFYW